MSTENDRMVISQKKLTLLLGGLGIALPTILYLGNLWGYGVERPLDSLSAYYYSGMRDVLVGILFAYGVFMVTYEGYGVTDRVLSIIGGSLAFVVALAPTNRVGEPETIISDIHVYAAASFYGILIIFCFFRFTKSGDKEKTTRKKYRNGVYILCGLVMTAALVSMVVIDAYQFEFSFIDNTTFWLEYAANSAFGTAWLVKGEGIFFLNDDPIIEMNPWELFGIFILILLATGSFFMLTNILLFT